MIDLNKEKPLSLKDACLHRMLNRPNISTIWRWITVGTRGVKLESVLIGGQRYTTDAAIQRFIRNLNTDQPAVTEDAASRTDALRAQLRAAGVLTCRR